MQRLESIQKCVSKQLKVLEQITYVKHMFKLIQNCHGYIHKNLIIGQLAYSHSILVTCWRRVFCC